MRLSPPHSEPSPPAASFRVVPPCAIAVANVRPTGYPKVLDFLIKPITGRATDLYGHHLTSFLQPVMRITDQHPKRIFLHDLPTFWICDRPAAACPRNPSTTNMADQSKFVPTVLHMFDIATAIADFPARRRISTLRCAPGRRSQRDLPNQFVDNGPAKGFKILRHYDEGAGAADDIAFVIFG
jgi:hypothetical protein